MVSPRFVLFLLAGSLTLCLAGSFGVFLSFALFVFEAELFESSSVLFCLTGSILEGFALTLALLFKTLRLLGGRLIGIPLVQLGPFSLTFLLFLLLLRFQSSLFLSLQLLLLGETL